MKRFLLGLLVAGCTFESVGGSGGGDGSTSSTSGGPGGSSSVPATTEETNQTDTDGATATTNVPTSVSGTGTEPTTSTAEGTSGGADEAGTDPSTTGGEGFVLCDDDDPDLRACYDFADVDGGVLTDLSMYGNDGVVGAVGVDRGPFGDAVRVSDSAEISVPDSDSLDVDGPASWEAWVFFDALPIENRVGILDNDGQYSMVVYPDAGMRCNGGGITVFAPNIPVGQWVHLACTHDLDEMTAWVDGVAIDTVGGGTPFGTGSNAPMSLGDTSPEFLEPMDGLLGAVRVWEVALSADQIEAAATTAM